VKAHFNKFIRKYKTRYWTYFFGGALWKCKKPFWNQQSSLQVN